MKVELLPTCEHHEVRDRCVPCMLADLRAKVEGLEWMWDREDTAQCVDRDAVLALIDEAQP